MNRSDHTTTPPTKHYRNQPDLTRQQPRPQHYRITDLSTTIIARITALQNRSDLSKQQPRPHTTESPDLSTHNRPDLSTTTRPTSHYKSPDLTLNNRPDLSTTIIARIAELHESHYNNRPDHSTTNRPDLSTTTPRPPLKSPDLSTAIIARITALHELVGPDHYNTARPKHYRNQPDLSNHRTSHYNNPGPNTTKRPDLTRQQRPTSALQESSGPQHCNNRPDHSTTGIGRTSARQQRPTSSLQESAGPQHCIIAPTSALQYARTSALQ
ncbi:hypothetical protein J6590_046203 [Homalodisca vitripennis]|nr:hypothetical protein J6590_046203 [Homalodisca vitripennis]